MPIESKQIWAVVPVKDLQHAKQRLTPILDADQRRALLCAMLQDVLGALARATCLAGVALVTRDETIRAIGDDFGVRVLTEPINRGHTDAVTLGAQTLSDEQMPGMLTLPADIPLVSPEEIAALVSAHASSPPALTIAPARDKLGSNAMLCSPPDVLPFRFGDNSFYPHLQRARDLGIEPRVVERPGLGLDIDTPDDLRTFAAQPSSTRAYQYLVRSGLIPALTAKSTAAD